MNRKSTQARAQILHLLCEGNSLRATSRIAGVSINTVTKLLVEAGQACSAYQDRHLRNLGCTRLQIDEIWSFVYSKERNIPQSKEGQFGVGSVWTFTCLDPESKLIPTFTVGERTAPVAREFMEDIRERLTGQVQISTDGHKIYLETVPSAFDGKIDFGIVQKYYASGPKAYASETRYSPGYCKGMKRVPMHGDPEFAAISTSHVERSNLTIRMGLRRFTRLTNAFSKKIENHIHALCLHFMHYNFVRVHKTLRTSPAMAAGVTDKLWGMEELVGMVDAYWSEINST